MSALANVRNTPEKNREPYGLGVKAATKVWQGSLVVLDAGYVAPGRTATGLQCLGRAAETVDNTAGGAGDKDIKVEPGIFRWGNGDSITAADRGKVAYVVDDQTVSKGDGGATRSIAGTIYDVDSAGVWVLSSLDADTSAALASEISARQAADLAQHVTGAQVSNLADNAVLGGVEVTTIVAVPDGATGDIDVVLTDKTEVTDIVIMKTAGAGGASDTITVKNGATAISNAMDINVADKTIVRAGTLDDASNVIAAGGTLRVTRTKASGANVACKVAVRGVRRA
jgi:hypothetical protein